MVIGPAWAVPMDVGGQFSGTVTGIMNMFGALAASMTALIYGYMFGKEMWVAPFILSCRSHGAGRLDLDFPDRSREIGGRGTESCGLEAKIGVWFATGGLERGACVRERFGLVHCR